MNTTANKAPEIAALNDLFRKRMPANIPGQYVQTCGISELPLETQVWIWAHVASFDNFEHGNNPYGERDFGAFEMEGAGKIFWKIDYYADANCNSGSEDPSDTAKSFRVLTVMLAGEW